MINLGNIVSKKNRILLSELVRTDFKLRYESSALGYVWSVLNPLLLFAVLYVVFSLFLGVGRNIEHFPVYLFVGTVMWRFFNEATKGGLKAIVSRGGLIRKINFPKYIIVISGTISALINLAINMIVVLLFCIINGVDMSIWALLVIPLILELYLFSLGIAFFLSAVNVYFRDIEYIWDVILQAGFYAVPIIYPLTLISEKHLLAAQLIIINPIAQVIQDMRYVLVTEDSVTSAQLFSKGYSVLIPFAIVLIVLAAGTSYFKKRSAGFAEHV